MGKPKIFCFIKSIDEQNKWFVSVALAENGQCLCSHVSSAPGYAKLDIGYTDIDLTSPEDRCLPFGPWKAKRKIFDTHYPDGYDLIWVDQPSVCDEPEWLAALSANTVLREAAEKHEAEEQKCQA